MRKLLSALLGVFLMTSCSFGYPPKVPEPDPPSTIPVPEEEIVEETVEEPIDGTSPHRQRVRKVIKKTAAPTPPPQVEEAPIPEIDPCKALVAENPSELVDKKLDCIIQNPRLLK